jgi:hypothetical protein
MVSACRSEYPVFGKFEFCNSTGKQAIVLCDILTLYSEVLLENLVVSQIVMKAPSLMELEISLPISEKPDF